MEFNKYKSLVNTIPLGKKLPDSVYIHVSAISCIPTDLMEITIALADKFNIDDDQWNIIKFNNRDFKLTLLNYPNFEFDSYPALNHSYTIDLQKISLRESDYSNSDNPPILHRKETLVSQDYPLYKQFASITKEGEQLGLYANSKIIGFKNNWERLISNNGYYINEDGRLKPKASIKTSVKSDAPLNANIERHRTAIDRHKLSQPMQILATNNYLDGDWSIFDYGCGKGDDVRELEAHGIDVYSWDPVYKKEGVKKQCDIVNLGFVLNVIEDRQERDDTLLDAWNHATKFLIVSIMISNDTLISKFTPYKDGIVTSRNTFQKYYSQSEIKSYLEYILDENPIAVGQGIFIVFKDKIEEQTFLSKRQRIKRDWQYLTERIIQERVVSLKKDVIDNNLVLFKDYWEATLDLGRIPANSEFEFSEQIRRIAGSHSKAHTALLNHFGEDLFNIAKNKRREDLLLYFSLGHFGRRKPQSKMPDALKRDIKSFFTSYNSALEESLTLLFSVGKQEVIFNACSKAFELINCGELIENHSFTFHRDHLINLPLTLRVYIGCAAQLYGEIDNFDLIKIHINSGKVSLMRYDDWEKETPMLLERVKIKMREQDIDFFNYSGEYEPQPLLNKILYLR